MGWSAPEILGEIVRNCPALCADIAPVIVSFHKEKMLTPGVLWAVGRMGKSNTEMVDYAVPIVLDYLQNTDNTIRGYAARALGEIGTSEIVKDLEKLKNDSNHIPVYENGELSEKTIGKIAEEAIERIKS